jgi:hypothetical protein
MQKGKVLIIFSKHKSTCIGIVPYHANFGSKRFYAWHEARYHKVGNTRRLRPDLGDCERMARYLDRGARPYRRDSNALAQLHQQMVAGEMAA